GGLQRHRPSGAPRALRGRRVRRGHRGRDAPQLGRLPQGRRSPGGPAGPRLSRPPTESALTSVEPASSTAASMSGRPSGASDVTVTGESPPSTSSTSTPCTPGSQPTSSFTALTQWPQVIPLTVSVVVSMVLLLRRLGCAPSIYPHGV